MTLEDKQLLEEYEEYLWCKVCLILNGAYDDGRAEPTSHNNITKESINNGNTRRDFDKENLCKEDRDTNLCQRIA